jgi:hypothetical protein
MNRTSILAGLVAALLGTFSGTAFAQGAAEAALTHALSASAGSKVGASLGHATNQLVNKMGQQTSRAMQSTTSTHTRRGTQHSAAAPPIVPSQTGATGPMIQSIQGAEPQRNTCMTPAPAEKPEPTQTKQKLSSCASLVAPQDNTYRSFVTLPPVK